MSHDPEAISHPDTTRWARLADHRYWILLGSLEMYLTLPVSDREFLLGWCFAEMYALKKLRGDLTKKPRGTGGVPVVAALPFNLPAWEGRAITWNDLEVVFGDASTEIVNIQAAPGLSDDQKRVIGHIVASDARKLEEVRARCTGGTSRRKFDRVREILDWAAGAEIPVILEILRYFRTRIRDGSGICPLTTSRTLRSLMTTL